MILTGDITQVDLPKNQTSGFVDAIEITKNIKGVAVVELNAKDVIRHRIVRDIIRAYSKKAEK